MSNRKIRIQDIATTEPNKILRTELIFDSGGMNYFSGSSKLRGYYLSAIPTKIQDGCASFLAFSGTCQLVEEAPRFSLRRLQEHAATIRQKPMYQQMIDFIVAKSKLTLAVTLPPPGAQPAAAPEPLAA